MLMKSGSQDLCLEYLMEGFEHLDIKQNEIVVIFYLVDLIYTKLWQMVDNTDIVILAYR